MRKKKNFKANVRNVRKVRNVRNADLTYPVREFLPAFVCGKERKLEEEISSTTSNASSTFPKEGNSRLVEGTPTLDPLGTVEKVVL